MGVLDTLQNLANIATGGTPSGSDGGSSTPTVVVVQTPEAPVAPTPAPAAPAVPTPAQAVPAAFAAAAAGAGPVAVENIVWVDPKTTKQWLGVLDVNGFFVEMEEVKTPSTSGVMAPGHAYQIGPVQSDGSFAVQNDLGIRKLLSSGAAAAGTAVTPTTPAATPAATPAVPASTAPTPAADTLWVDLKGKQWTGYMTSAGKFHSLAALVTPKQGLVPGHAYRIGQAPVFALGLDLGVKTAGGPAADTATIALVGVGTVLALGLAGWAAYKAMEPKEEEPGYPALPSAR